MLTFLYFVLLIWSLFATIHIIACLESHYIYDDVACMWAGPLTISVGLNSWAVLSGEGSTSANVLALAVLMPPLAFVSARLFRSYVMDPLEDWQLRKMEEDLARSPLRTFTSTAPKDDHLPTITGDINEVVRALQQNLDQLEAKSERKTGQE